MRRRIVAMMMVLSLIFSTAGVANAQEDRASDYLSIYGISLEAQGNGRIEIFYHVDGKGLMDCVGAQALYIDYYNGEEWIPYETQLGMQHPDFYSYDAFGHIGFAYFDGESGVDYRVTLQAYARGSDGGSDTGLVTSNSVTCW